MFIGKGRGPQQRLSQEPIFAGFFKASLFKSKQYNSNFRFAVHRNMCVTIMMNQSFISIWQIEKKLYLLKGGDPETKENYNNFLLSWCYWFICIYILHPICKLLYINEIYLTCYCHTRLELGFWIQAELWWEPEWDLKSHLTTYHHPPTHPPTHPPGSSV